MILLLFGYIRKVQKLSAEAHRVLPETCIAFSFPLRGVCVVFRRRKAEQTVFINFNTPCDISFIRTNRTWLIAKTARCARSFCDGTAPIFIVTVREQTAVDIALDLTVGSIKRTYAAQTDTRFGLDFEHGLGDYAHKVAEK